MSDLNVSDITHLMHRLKSCCPVECRVVLGLCSAYSIPEITWQFKVNGELHGACEYLNPVFADEVGFLDHFIDRVTSNIKNYIERVAK